MLTRRQPLWLFLRHERLTVAMVLAEMQHDTAPRGQSMARTGKEVDELNYTATLRTHPPLQAASTVYCTFGDDEEMLAAGEVAGPQERDQRCAVEHMVEFVPVVPVVGRPDDWPARPTDMIVLELDEVDEEADEEEDVLDMFDESVDRFEQSSFRPQAPLQPVHGRMLRKRMELHVRARRTDKSSILTFFREQVVSAPVLSTRRKIVEVTRLVLLERIVVRWRSECFRCRTKFWKSRTTFHRSGFDASRSRLWMSVAQFMLKSCRGADRGHPNATNHQGNRGGVSAWSERLHGTDCGLAPQITEKIIEVTSCHVVSSDFSCDGTRSGTCTQVHVSCQPVLSGPALTLWASSKTRNGLLGSPFSLGMGPLGGLVAQFRKTGPQK